MELEVVRRMWAGCGPHRPAEVTWWSVGLTEVRGVEASFIGQQESLLGLRPSRPMALRARRLSPGQA
ncbi:hypothetical protein NDU88_003066 [Pleurodeles waltl]|uniref:Uncharacterized protein n=1 Tax=Pleurodeles waltl TaxID=8319 RepID=A0AAV7Q8G5_PLEWA|nr:hypothetical protein NDU88_003066 [Pleurodeles waltl]